MDMLCCTAALQSLELLGAIPICESERQPGCQTVVRLDQLSHLALHCHRYLPYVIHFTKHLKIPKAAYIRMSSQGTTSDHIPNILHALHSHDLSENHSHLTINVKNGVQLILQTPDQLTDHPAEFIDANLETFKKFTSLEISLNRGEMYPSKVWGTFLQTMKHVSELRLKEFNRSALCHLFHQLGVGPDSLLPVLRKLDIQTAQHSPEALAPLVDTLRTRMRRLSGVGIQHLSIRDDKGVELGGVREILDVVFREVGLEFGALEVHL